jgi:ribosomal protein L7/L12
MSLFGPSQIDELEAKVERLTRQVEVLARQLGVELEAEPAPEVSDEVLALVQRGKKIDAIKKYREEHNVGLQEAKRVIDGLDHDHR